MSESQANDPAASRRPRMSRRTLIKTVGIAAGAGAVGTGAVPGNVRWVRRGDAWAPIVVAAGGAVVGAAVNEYLSSSSGDSNEVKQQRLYSDLDADIRGISKRAETTLGLQSDILSFARDSWFSQGKLTAIEAINEGKQKSEVKSAALDAVEKEVAVYQENLVTINQDLMDTIKNYREIGNNNDITFFKTSGVYDGYNFIETKIELVDGRKVDISLLNDNDDSGSDYSGTVCLFAYSSEDVDNTGPDGVHPQTMTSGSKYNNYQGPNGNVSWRSLEGLDKMTPKFEEVQSYWNNDLKLELETWINKAYDQVQSGNIDPGEYITEQELYRNLSEQEDTPLASASLRFLNIPSDTEVSSNIEVDYGNHTITATDVMLGVTEENKTLEAGTTINPSNDSADYIAAFSPVNVSVDFSFYANDSLDGGELTLTGVPVNTAGQKGVGNIGKWIGEDPVFVIQTNKDETAQIRKSDLTYNNDTDPGYWTVDLSEQLEEPIADVTAVNLYAPDELTDQTSGFVNTEFTITEISQNGETIESVDYKTDDREPHTADNYFTEDEWEARQKELQEQLDRIEELSQSGGGFFGGGFGGLGGLPSLPGFNTVESAAIAIVAFLGFDVLRS